MWNPQNIHRISHIDRNVPHPAIFDCKLYVDASMIINVLLYMESALVYFLFFLYFKWTMAKWQTVQCRCFACIFKSASSWMFDTIINRIRRHKHTHTSPVTPVRMLSYFPYRFFIPLVLCFSAFSKGIKIVLTGFG